MADDSNTVSEESEPKVSFSVKSSSDAKYAITVTLSSTVAELKQKLSASEYANIPPERQRLIYSGRVLKDADKISDCKIKDGNTVHLVKGAESNARQNPANQGGAASVPTGAGTQPASHVPTTFAAGTGAGDPLAHLTGARYAGFHGLPGADMFGADGGMGAPPDSDAMLRMLEDPNVAQQINEAMNNPAVLNMLRNNPMIRDNPMARAAIEDPDMRRMLLNPDMLRMQRALQRQMGGGAGGAGPGTGAFPMPGQTDTTPGSDAAAAPQTNAGTAGSPPPAGNPFAALFGGAGPGSTGAASAQNPFGNLFGAGAGTGAGAGAEGDANSANPLATMAQQMMQNPQAMQQMMQMMGGARGAEGGFNPFGGVGAAEPTAPADTRPPEERYEEQLRQLNDMGFFDFDRNVQALRRSGGSVQGAVEYLFSNL